MSGHSKWANIKRRKAAVDAKKGAVFTKLGRELILAAREGGGNPDSKFRVRLAVDRARSSNMPMDSIQRAIMKGTGELEEGTSYDEVLYEGYGPGGAAVMAEIMTDNRNRIAQEIRYIFSRNDGSLGESGCVAWMLSKRGSIIVLKENDLSEDDLMLLALEAGAEDITDEGDAFEVVTTPGGFQGVLEAVRAAGLNVVEAGVTLVPQNTVRLEGETAEKCLHLIEALEDHEEVQEVYSNCEIDEKPQCE